jgi:hypothetical protein
MAYTLVLFSDINQKCPIVALLVTIADVRTLLHAHPVAVFVAACDENFTCCSNFGTIYTSHFEGHTVQREY